MSQPRFKNSGKNSTHRSAGTDQRQVEELGAAFGDYLLHACDFVRRQVVEHDDIATSRAVSARFEWEGIPKGGVF